MATEKRLFLIYEIENFSDAYLEKVTKFQSIGLLCFGVLSHLLVENIPSPVLLGLNDSSEQTVTMVNKETFLSKFILSEILKL